MHKDVCCFIGGECKRIYTPTIVSRIKNEVQKAINDGYRYFITGLMTDVDIVGARVVIEEREKNNDIKLICYPKYKDFQKGISDIEMQMEIDDILNNADNVVYFYPKRFDAYEKIGTIVLCSSSRAIGVFDVISRQMHDVIECGKKKGVEFINLK